MSRRSEKRLIRRIAAGRQEFCAEVIREHYARVYRLCVHLCRDTHVAEDLTQETFATCWAKIDGFNKASSLGTWLHRIAYHKFVDWYRRKQRSEQGMASVPFDASHSACNPLDEILADEQSKLLYETVNRLEHAERTVVVLHYFQGLSFRQIAAVLGQPAGTVKWRSSKALRQLKTMLDER